MWDPGSVEEVRLRPSRFPSFPGVVWNRLGVSANRGAASDRLFPSPVSFGQWDLWVINGPLSRSRHRAVERAVSLAVSRASGPYTDRTGLRSSGKRRRRVVEGSSQKSQKSRVQHIGTSEIWAPFRGSASKMGSRKSRGASPSSPTRPNLVFRPGFPSRRRSTTPDRKSRSAPCRADWSLSPWTTVASMPRFADWKTEKSDSASFFVFTKTNARCPGCFSKNAIVSSTAASRLPETGGHSIRCEMRECVAPTLPAATK
mmetsp:Transcript_25154/g.84476  ORF Transcript_25154/g.84476 Transcript_25154/m.84476 type:complete len:258 (+) Transcript_25154:1733-2506(+)